MPGRIAVLAMYIGRVHISNYRCFKDTTVDFRPGLNVVIGENNAGKTTLLKALMLVFDRRGRMRPTVYDFCRLPAAQPADAFPETTPTTHNTVLKWAPPTISVQVTICSSQTDTPGDRALVASWLTRLDAGWEAQLTYAFFLPEEHEGPFKEAVEAAGAERFYDTVEEYLPKYVARVYGGNRDTNVIADGESLRKFDCQFLDAIRDVESEMFAGSNPLFRAMLEEVLDYGVNEPTSRDQRLKFSEQAGRLRKSLLERLDTDRLFKLATETGAADGGTPTLGGALNETDLIAALRLFVARRDFSFPATHNGLGYNNLIYISLVLASLSFRTSVERLGQNAAIFPLLLIEEPEAHLHPALQHKLLAHIVDRVGSEPRVNRQVFVTTHSTHVTAAAGLDSIVCLSIADDNAIHVSYPTRVFPDTDAGRQSRDYVERYLDATKSAMLFAKATLFVEGIAEQLVVPEIARILKRSFDTHRVAVVRVDGVTFKHFLTLFGGGGLEENRQYALRRRVACLVDADPSRRETSRVGARWKSCFPFQLNRDSKAFSYREESGALEALRALATDRENILIKSASMTFEYDVALANPRSAAILSDALERAEDLRAFCSKVDSVPSGLQGVLPKDVMDDLDVIVNRDERLKCHYAAVYVTCAEDAKGAHAFALQQTLRASNPTTPPAFICPGYVREAIEWVTMAP